MATNTVKKLYSDIDFTFTRKPVTNDISLSYDSMAVLRSIRNLLLTNHYEKLFNPDLGSNINALLFEPINPITSSSLETEIKSVIENYEPRALLKSVVVTANSDQNSYSVTLEFYIQNATLPTITTILLERNR